MSVKKNTTLWRLHCKASGQKKIPGKIKGHRAGCHKNCQCNRKAGQKIRSNERKLCAEGIIWSLRTSSNPYPQLLGLISNSDTHKRPEPHSFNPYIEFLFVSVFQESHSRSSVYLIWPEGLLDG